MRSVFYRNRPARCLLSFIFLLSATAAMGREEKKEMIPFDSLATSGVLANGLHYYIRPNGKPEQKAELRLVVNAGSILEDEDQQGLAHFMEHMNFNGTRNYPKNELVDFLQSIGVSFGADLNAYTGFDATVYILPIPTDKPGNLDKGFQVLADWAQGALLTGKDIDEERNVVLEESRGGKGADDRMSRKYLPHMLAGSRYADRLPIGKDELLKSFDPEQLRRFYKDWYRPDLMAVVVVGDVTVPQAREMIEKYFKGLKNPAKERPRESFPVPPFKGQEFMMLSDKEASRTDFTLIYSARKTPAVKSLEAYRASLIRSLFLQMLNSRLSELTQVAQPPFIRSYCSISGAGRGYESFQLNTVGAGAMDTAIMASVRELVRAEQYGFTASELDLARRRLENYIGKAYNERNTTESASLVDGYVQHFLDQDPVPGIEQEYRYFREMLPGIGLEEVNRLAKSWLADHQNYFALVTGPEASAGLNSSLVLKPLLQQALVQRVTPRPEKVLATSLLDKEPAAGRITEITRDTALGTTTYLLSNRVKVTVKATDFKSDEILLSGIKKGGQGKYPAADRSNYTFLSSVTEAMGYGSFTPLELKDFLTGKTVSVQAGMGMTTDVISGSASVKDLESLLQLTYLKLTAPRMDTALFRGYIARQKAARQFSLSDPQTAFADTFTKVLYQRDPRAAITVPTPEDFDRIVPQRVLQIYKAELGNADGLQLFLVGNIDEQKLKPLLERYIASLPVLGTVPEYKDNGLRPINGNHELYVEKGSEAQSLILGLYYGEIPYTEDLDLKADLLSDVLNIRITEELREKIGGIYSGGVSASLVRVPYPHYTMQYYLPCGPESVDTLLKAFTAEVKNICTNGPSAKDLDKVKQAQLEAYKENRKRNGFWAANLAANLFWGDDADRILHFERYLEQVTAKDLQVTAQRLFDGKNTFRAVLDPEPAKK